ncbi:hypothetical protein JM79_1094 [Gramella sp. Hel_I_59]|uniref:polysaccharide pyruvyl transferase family protein n=1 Tax=Gramella sp. Hel_I_59 TaxID=1249978 RepID=UPI00114EB0C1|nr:polysaccharide pyruvyl transferase family protein [Gramella sp. Hel_I_59]TQI70185.1 hypothetical protein JM79_1094 [Gramella sp. Hel_I_59]
MLNSLIKSFQRKQSRRESLKRIQNANQTNMGVVNLHRVNPQNVGDFYCAPHHYFESLQNSELDIFGHRETDKSKLDHFVNSISRNSLIIGGGGLLNRGSFEKQMKVFEQLASNDKKVVMWGVGHNSKNSKNYRKIYQYNLDISKFGLAGTRDFSAPGEYVPCVSCMHPIFNESFSSKNELGIIFHTDSLKSPSLIEKFSSIPNIPNNASLEEVISLIGSCENIITNSYHGMYWGMLLKKKVSVVPNSSKFFDFKYQPNFTTFEDSLTDYKKAQSYDGILEECKSINQIFYHKVSEYLELQ